MEKQNPKVSVVIPVYNCGRFLEPALRSILDQTLTEIELIVVNDGSTDGSASVINRLACEDLRIIPIHAENKGIVSALNIGLARATGTYIARMDGDDLALPNRLRAQSDFLEANLDHSYVGSIFQVIDEHGNLGHSQRGQSLTRQTDFTVFPPNVLCVPHPTLMARRSCFMEVGGYRDAFPYAEDRDLFIRLSRLGKGGVIPEVLLRYRIHSGSLSTKHSAVQLHSALKAEAVGLIASRTGVEPFGLTASQSVGDVVRGRTGIPAESAWASVAALRRAEHDLDRRDVRAAWRSLARLAVSLGSGARALRDADGLGQVVKLALRSAARAAVMQIRG